MDHRRVHLPPSSPAYERRHPSTSLALARGELQFRARNRLVDGGLPDVTRLSRNEASRCTDSLDANASPSSYVITETAATDRDTLPIRSDDLELALVS